MRVMGSFNPAAFARCLPFAAFMVLLALRGALGEWQNSGLDARWVYALTVIVVGFLLAQRWRQYGELARQNWPSVGEMLTSIGVGLVVFVLWIHLDAPWMQIGTPAASFVPIDVNGALAWPLIGVRFIGAALLVPVMEELFWRSFLMRWIQVPRFEGLEPGRVGLRAVLISTFLFMLAHTLWLAAIIAGLAYALVYIRSGRLWTAVIAHGVTNAALAVWVVYSGNWQFW